MRLLSLTIILWLVRLGSPTKETIKSVLDLYMRDTVQDSVYDWIAQRILDDRLSARQALELMEGYEYAYWG